MTTQPPVPGETPPAGDSAAPPPAPGAQPAVPPSAFRDPGAPRQAAPPPTGQQPAADPERRRTTVDDLGGAEALRSRLERDRRAMLRREFGTDDPAAIKAQLAQAEETKKKLAEYEAKDAEAKRSQMSELDRLKADLEAERVAREEAERRAREADERSVAIEREQVVRSAASKHIDPEFYDLAKLRLAQHCKALEKTAPKKLAAMTEEDIEDFFKELAKKSPRLAPTQPVDSKQRADAQRSTTRLASQGTRRPLAGGAPQRQAPGTPARPASAAAPANGKTPRPGLPNSMSKAELADYLKSRGMRPLG